MTAASSGPDVDPAGRLLRAGAVPALALTALAAAGALVLDGGASAASAAIGGLLASAAFAVGPLLMRAGRAMSPAGLQASAVGAYVGVVVLLGLAWVVLGAVDWFEGRAAAVGVLAAAAAWLAGQYRATVRLRTLLYGDGEPRGE